MSTTQSTLLELKNIRKEYGSTVALDSIDLTLLAGRVHGLVGENGAGKSTLVKILSGVEAPDAGVISYRGNVVDISTPTVARKMGISTVFQELSLIGDLSLAENMLLKNAGRWTGSRRDRENRGRWIADAWGLAEIDTESRVGNLSLRDKQLVEILCAIDRPNSVLILDEPTSALLPDDTKWLRQAVGRLTERGGAVIFISHVLDEVEAFCDEISVQRNGRIVSTVSIGDFRRPKAIEQMIGRSLESAYPEKSLLDDTARVSLTVRDLQVRNKVHGATFEIKEGEILGIVALDGQGQEEIFGALSGDLPISGGVVQLNGKTLKLRSPKHALAAGGKVGGISLVPADRKTQGTVLDMSVRKNISLPVLGRLSKLGVVSEKMETIKVAEMMEAVQVLATKIDDPVRSLSGGNQQKVVFARAVISDVQVVLLFDAMRGVDVGTKYEFYKLIEKLSAAGKSVLMYSTEIPEVVNICHRALVCYKGQIIGEKSGDDLTETKLMAAAIGLEGSESH